MTKAEIVVAISDKIGVEKVDVQAVIEAFMKEVKGSLSNGETVFLRGFGSFAVKHRAEKTGRNISKNTTIIIPAHDVPAFKPSKVFVEQVKNSVSKSNN
jgi:DNA-binding protein HU-beta